jgi:predicted TIM-barrel fold metal-dependent hydrolase
VIDTHVHHLDLKRFRYPWLDDPDFDTLRRDYSPADYRADTTDIDIEGWVHVQADVDHHSDPVEETVWISRLADDAQAAGVPGPLGCVVYADLRSPDLHTILERHCEQPLTRGVRQEAWFDPASTRADIPRQNFLNDPAFRHGYATLAQFELSFDLLVWPHQLPDATMLAATAPDVPVVLEHLGLPDPERDHGLRRWRAAVATFAELPHAHAKLSAFSLLGSPPPSANASSRSSKRCSKCSERTAACSAATFPSSGSPAGSRRSTNSSTSPSSTCPPTNAQTSYRKRQGGSTD